MTASRRYSAALTEDLNSRLLAHLLRADGQEDLCFALWHPSDGLTRTTALLAAPVFPMAGERLVHGNASFLPRYFERALGHAMEAKGGLAFLHSHPGPGWQGLSDDDVHAERSIAAQAMAATGLPLVGLTAGSDGAWSARFWPKVGPRAYALRPCENVRVVGIGLAVTWHPQLRPAPAFRPALERTTSAWGVGAQSNLARLSVAIVGAGSVGSMVGEALARTGFESVGLLDFDAVEERNLDRLFHATPRDIGRAKVEVLARGLRASATARAIGIRASEASVVEEEGLRFVLDYDVAFSCVDRPWPRSVLNAVAMAHLIPVVDGGIHVRVTTSGALRSADWRAHIAAPGRRCLECLGQYNPGIVAAEQAGHLDDPTYIAGLPGDHALRANENVFAFSMATASMEVLQLLMMVVRPMGIASPGAQLYHFVPGLLDRADVSGCEPSCAYANLTARGDHTELTFTGSHRAAVEARRVRRAKRVKRPLSAALEAGARWLLWR